MSEPRLALVTGAGTGIGKATAVALARTGYELILVGRTEARLRAVADSLPTTAEAAVCDLADVQAVTDLAAQLSRGHRRLDALINCGAVCTPGTITGLRAAAADQMWAVNVMGPMMLVRGCLPLLEAAAIDGSPAIVNITTSIGQRGWPGSGIYAATKAALESLTRTWAVELAPQGIRCVAVAPGAVETGMAAIGRSPEQVAQLRQWQRDHTPLRRIGDPTEIADAVTFICRAGTFITGAVIPVDGGASVG